MRTLRGKTAIVTGASRGIGRATALALADQGARVAVCARTVPQLDDLADEIRSMGAECAVIPTDVTRRDQVTFLIEETVRRWGQIDILVANAGAYFRAPVTETQVDMLREALELDFFGSVYPILDVLPSMVERRSGHIVVVASADARTPLVLDAPYVAAKAALTGFVDVMRQELRGTGVDVTTVFPGRVDTPLLANVRVPAISAKIPAEAVARAIVGAIRHRRAEVMIPPQVRLLYYLKVISPRFADWLGDKLHFEGWETPGIEE